MGTGSGTISGRAKLCGTGGFGREYAPTKSSQDKAHISLCDVRLLPPALNSLPSVRVRMTLTICADFDGFSYKEHFRRKPPRIALFETQLLKQGSTHVLEAASSLG